MKKLWLYAIIGAVLIIFWSVTFDWFELKSCRRLFLLCCWCCLFLEQSCCFSESASCLLLQWLVVVLELGCLVLVLQMGLCNVVAGVGSFSASDG
jgi:hypothetical protein